MSTPESHPPVNTPAEGGGAPPPSEVETLLREILSTLRARPTVPAENPPSTEAEVLLREIISTLRNHPAVPLAGGAQAPYDPHAGPGPSAPAAAPVLESVNTPPPRRRPPPDEVDIASVHIFFAVITWLIIGITALGSEGMQNSTMAVLIVTVFTFAQPVLIITMISSLAENHPESGKGGEYILAGLVGVLTTSACTIAFTDMTTAATIFWCVSGNYIGWILVGVGQYIWRMVPLVGRGRRAARASSSGYELVDQEAVDSEDDTERAGSTPTEAKVDNC